MAPCLVSGFERREVIGGLVALAALMKETVALASPSKASTVQGPALDDLWYVDPELRPIAESVRSALKDRPAPSDENLKLLRTPALALERPPLADVPFEWRRISGLSGQPDVQILIVNCKLGASQPGILHMHGGGFYGGAVKAEIRRLQDLAKRLGVTIVSVEYRLAPEARYSESVADNYAGLLWLFKNAESLGVDANRLAVMGESAGGGHAALLAIAARDRGEVPLQFQCLTYPMLDDRTGTVGTVPAHIGTLLWNARSNRYGWRSFLGQEPGTSSVPTAAVPARTANLAKLPPTWIGVGGIDLFLGEDITYAKRLLEAGVSTELLVIPGAFHGFDIVAPNSRATLFYEAKLAALRRGLGL